MDDPSGSIWNIVGLLVLVGLSAFFSGSETSLTSVNKLRVRYLANEGSVNARRLLAILSTPNRLLTTLLVGNNIVNIAASSLATVVAIDLFGEAGVGIAVLTMTVLILIFGEITPKTLASQNPERFAVAVSKVISYLMVILRPIVTVFVGVTKLLLKLVGAGGRGQRPFVTEEEIKTIVQVGEEEGVLNNSERQMIHQIFKFGDMTVDELMIPRVDVVGFPIEYDIRTAATMATKSQYSRIPVYQGTIDQIMGFVHVKDLLSAALEGNGTKLTDITRPVVFVPESKKLDDLFAELRQSKTHMAVVLDEYGVTAGIATLEDLIEEIVGDINDEYDTEENLVLRAEDNSLMVDGRVSLDEVAEILGLTLDDQEVDTIGGFVFTLFGRVPKEGEQVVFEDRIQLSVEKMKGRRIVRVSVTRL